MASNSRRKSGSSASSTGRKRVVIGASETVRVRYKKNEPEVESERRRAPSSRERSTPRAPKGPGARLANAKRDEREQRQRVLARRRALVLAGTIALVVAAVWGIVALWRAPIFTVEKINVTGNRRLSQASVL